MIIFKNYSYISLNNISILHRKKFVQTREKILFLDRDGVLIDDVHYIKSKKDVNLKKNVADFLTQARELKYDICVVTNQSSVSRSIITEEKYLEITNEMLSLLNINLLPDFILTSFHHPQETKASQHWRKPGTGMFDFILNNFSYSKNNAIIVGDKLSDLIPAHSVGIRKFIFVKTDIRKEEYQNVKKWVSKLKDSLLINYIDQFDKDLLNKF